MSSKRSKPPTQEDIDKGWLTQDSLSVAKSFYKHGRLLLMLTKLKVITPNDYSILCRDFQQVTWAKLRDGDDIEWL